MADSLTPEYGGNLINIRGFEEDLKINISDVRDEHGLRHLLHGQRDLFNMAGQTSHMDSMANPFIDLEINCTAQLKILEACWAVNFRKWIRKLGSALFFICFHLGIIRQTNTADMTA